MILDEDVPALQWVGVGREKVRGDCLVDGLALVITDLEQED
jgi:hypothetical protein